MKLIYMQRTINLIHAMDPSKLGELEEYGVPEIAKDEKAPEDTYYKYTI